MDFGKIENIILVAVASAIGVFFLVTFFLVVSKGKRKCKAADVALRVFASIVMLVCAVLFVGAIFTELTGDTRIDAVANPVVLYLGGKATELPMPELFVMLTQKTVHEIIIIEFLAAFAVLSADCMLANKKYDKHKKSKKHKSSDKTPDEIKRDAELEKIKRLGNSAVKKSSAAASTDSASATDGDKKSSEKPFPEQPDEDFDWRVDNAPATEHGAENREFVGLHDTPSDDAFDSFDAAETADDGSEIYPENDDISDEQDDVVGETAFGADSGESSDEGSGEVVTEESDDFDDAYNKAEVENAETSDTPWYARGGDETELSVPDDDADTELFAGESETDIFENNAVSGDRDETSVMQGIYDDVQPDRGIYIPPIRTVKRTPPAAAKKPVASGSVKRSTDKIGGTSKKQTTKAAPQKRAADGEPVAKKASAKKPVKKQSGNSSAKQSDGKKLPVTRRYVILDRTNAVNMFGNYLKERDGAGKDKLESSINTIIIK